MSSQDQVEAIARRLARRLRVSISYAKLILEMPAAHARGSR